MHNRITYLQNFKPLLGGSRLHSLTVWPAIPEQRHELACITEAFCYCIGKLHWELPEQVQRKQQLTHPSLIQLRDVADLILSGHG